GVIDIVAGDTAITCHLFCHFHPPVVLKKCNGFDLNIPLFMDFGYPRELKGENPGTWCHPGGTEAPWG
ncbi:MAG: hypothetical protein LUQ67_01835, partial [Methanomicrobiales archaeon]|nr:hypothetical protein [Methanomicrobiales archaeon]